MTSIQPTIEAYRKINVKWRHRVTADQENLTLDIPNRKFRNGEVTCIVSVFMYIYIFMLAGCVLNITWMHCIKLLLANVFPLFAKMGLLFSHDYLNLFVETRPEYYAI